MTVNVTKPQINVREKLSELDKPSGIAGEAILRSETPQEVFNYINAGRRNLVINGDMQVAQRGTSFSTHNEYTLDRWKAGFNSAGISFTVSSDSDAPPDFNNSLKVTINTGVTSGSSDVAHIRHRIEGQNFSHLNFGTSDAKPYTISFWVKSSITGIFSVGTLNSATNRAIAKEYTINSANTWERKTITVSGDTSGTYLTDSGIGLDVLFDLGSGSNFRQSPDSYTSTVDYASTNQTNLVGTTGATWQITGVQLEVGKVATPFEHRSYGEELALCQRYAYVTEGSVGSGGVAITTTQPHIHIQYPVIMRSAPSASLNTSGSFKISDDYSADKTASSLSVGVTNSTNFKSRIRVDGFSGLTVGRFYAPDGNSSTTAKILFDAEL